MTAKLIGAILLGVGLVALLLIAGINKYYPRTSNVSSRSNVKKYRLSHEYENKGFSEKGQSEGILDIPRTAENIETKTHEFRNDSLFSSSSNNDKSPPGDSF
ncbi:TPA: hypothetical protein OL683_004513 [Citrobacter freundii]|uniref:hypothetical protein n=1 Tax=Citrobacter freundii complex TaxID=1344959 RepID=UPI0009AE6DD6|nr:hypothetical protein [Citrobacter sp. A316]OPW90169.1 hypothetical protein BZK41_23545 [Citrobacter sp. A316]HBB6718077.1 hypothetical protein [Serratia marcescens]HCQ6955824.1 hypothetical protein [Citrobacter freundii]